MAHKHETSTHSNSQRRSRTRKHKSGFSDWLHRTRSSDRLRKKLIMNLIAAGIVLLCLVIGYYILGPRLGNSE